MVHSFDREYWDRHWQGDRTDTAAMAVLPANPHLVLEVGGLAPGTALDAGCGAGAEAIWLASHGWQVTAVDIADEALNRAGSRAAAAGVTNRVAWVRADLSTWEPAHRFDLVTTHYAHPAIPQLDFYDRIASWVAPGGTLLIVGHLSQHAHRSGAQLAPGEEAPPAAATVTADAIRARLDPAQWAIVTAEQSERALTGHDGRAGSLHDVVVRATRHP